MFMRANFVTGHAGVLGAILILVMAQSITFLTSLSIGAISTNMQVRGGGAYYMISRVIGPEFGGAIGLALFAALALSVPFYVLGFTEALVRSAPALEPHFQIITITAAICLFVIAYVGAHWAIRTQYVIMAILFVSIVAFLGGAIANFSMDTLRANWNPMDVGHIDGVKPLGIWILFAIYFPAVTGIDAGVNMSGDLKDPAKSIPRGALAAIAVGFLVYLAEIVLCGGAFERTALVAKPYQTLVTNALFGTGFLVAAGVFAATLSSALGSYLSSPRVLQAVSRDPIVPLLKPFGTGTAKGDEPRRALIFVGVITIVVLIWAGNKSEGASLNAVARVISMFFLYSYGTINLAAFVEAVGHNPSFRPRFRLFHWTTALLGAVGCLVTALFIDARAAVIAAALIASIIWYVKHRQLKATFGDARRGFVYSQVRNGLVRLSAMQEDARNWRPTMLVFSGNPNTREALVSYAVWMESGRGIVYLANVLVGELSEVAARRPAAIKQLKDFCEEKNMHVFPVVAIGDSVEDGVSMLLQTTTVGPLRPNVAVFGWSNQVDEEQLLSFTRQLRIARAMDLSLLVIEDRGMPRARGKKRIDLWWRGERNGSLMLLLAHLLVKNWEWSHTEIRVLRVVENEAGREPATAALADLINDARVDAAAEILVSERPLPEILETHSADADCVFFGFEPPKEGNEQRWQQGYTTMLKTMPTTILVHSVADEDVLE